MKLPVLSAILLAGYVLFNLYGNKVACLVQPLSSYPPDLEALFSDAKSMGDLTKQTGETIFWSCMQMYVSKFADRYSETVSNMTRSQRTFLLDFFHDIRANIDREMSQVVQQPERIRKEIRMMSYSERADYLSAIDSLKMDMRLPPNTFDFMATFHSGEVQEGHFGPGFLGYHRVVLYTYESLLQLHVPSVTLPYWASVLDNDMDEPTNSVIWSDDFMGNPVGQPELGSRPFGNWTQINPKMVYERNVGFGSLYTWDNIRQILRRRKNSQILQPTCEEDSNIEQFHNNVHVWVGGSMSRLSSAARDPIFYMNQAFSDMIWQDVRNQQRRDGIDPSTDYSFNATDRRFRAKHAPTASLGLFIRNIFDIRFQQIDGLSMFFDSYIQYAPIPSCSKKQPDCGSLYLYCETSGEPRCVSRTTLDVQRLVDAFPIGTTGTAPEGSTSSRENQGPHIPQKIAPLTRACHAPQPVNDFPIRETSKGQKLTESDWMKIPTRILLKRPLEYQNFRDYSLYDYYSQKGNRVGQLKQAFTEPGDQQVYSNCDRKLKAIGTIKIVSYGLNYDGSAEEYALIDNRLGISETTSFITVKRPKPGAPSEAIIAAFDSCGRVCQQYCLKNISGDNITSEDMPKFGGGIRVTTDTPLQYGENFAEAILSSWQIKAANSFPSYDQTNAPITFFCDDSKEWFWPTGDQH